jgi:hypothetical protein
VFWVMAVVAGWIVVTFTIGAVIGHVLTHGVRQ